MLIDAAMRADTPARRTECLALARDAVIEFKTEIVNKLQDEPEEQFQRRALDQEQPDDANSHDWNGY